MVPVDDASCAGLCSVSSLFMREDVFSHLGDGVSSTVLAFFSLFRATMMTEGWLVHSEHISACFAWVVCAPCCLGSCVA